MNDFEARLHETLDHRAGRSMDASVLADGARRRVRRRRTTRTVVAAAVVAVALPIGFSQFGGLGSGGADQGTTVASNENSGIRKAADGFRYETWHGVSVQVPTEWEAGAMSAWCSGVDTPEEVTPVVTRPDTMAIRIACEPANGYGVTLGQPTSDNLDYDKSDGAGDGFRYAYLNRDSQRYPQGAWIGSWIDGDESVTVVTQDRELTQRIIDSAMRVDQGPTGGCPVQLNGEGISLCRYRVNELLATRTLTGEQAAAALEVLTSSPVRAKEDRCLPAESDQTAGPDDRTIVYQDGEMVATAYFRGCGEVLVVDSTQKEGLIMRKMTEDVRSLVDLD